MAGGFEGANPAGTGRGDDKNGPPVGAGEASWSQEEGDEDTFTAIGEVALAVVERLEQDRAARIAPRERPTAPAGGNVAPQAGRRPLCEGGHMQASGR